MSETRACVECGASFIQPVLKQGGGKRKIYCSPKCRSRSWANGNTEKRKGQVQKYDRKPQSKLKRKEYSRKQTLKKYGWDETKFITQLERQNFRCAGCCSPIDQTTARIDHDHDTGAVRGLLCDNCNWALGHAKDNRENLYRLAAYLRHDLKQYHVYVIGSLRNSKIPEVAEAIRDAGMQPFDEWFCAGPEADDYFQRYHTYRGATYAEALRSVSAEHTFYFDKSHLDLCDAGVLVMPAGKSGHLELGYMSGRGKKTFILQDKEPERFDIMPQFASAIVYDVPSLITGLENGRQKPDNLL